MKKWMVVVLLGFGALLLSACAASATPVRIASYPAGSSHPSQSSRVYSASMQLEVTDPSAAAERAVQISQGLGGYLVGSWTHYQDWTRVVTLELAVPSMRFNELRRSLYTLGTLVGEQVDSDQVNKNYDAQAYSHLSLDLMARPVAVEPRPDWPEHRQPWWNPLQTFYKAMGVSAVILTFLVDALIWILVVGGPFVLIGLGVRYLLRRSGKGKTV